MVADDRCLKRLVTWMKSISHFMEKQGDIVLQPEAGQPTKASLE
jgi:hypothetical protein